MANLNDEEFSEDRKKKLEDTVKWLADFDKNNPPPPSPFSFDEFKSAMKASDAEESRLSAAGDRVIAQRTAVPDPSAVRENNQRKISQLSPNMDDPAIASVTKETSAPSRMSADGAYNDMTFGSKMRRTYQRDADGHKAGDQVWFDVNADGSTVERKEAPDSEKAAQNGGMWSKVVGDREADLWRQRNLMELQSKKRQLQMRAAPKVEMGNLMQMANDGLRGGYARDVKDKNGNNYKQYDLSEESLAGVNSKLMKVGIRNSVKGVTATVMVDKGGNPIGEVRFDILRQKDGNVNDKGEIFHDRCTMSEAQDLFVRGLIDSGTISGSPGAVESAARNRAVAAFGGGNPSDWAVGGNSLSNEAEKAKTANANAQAELRMAQAKAGGFRPGADYSGKNVATIISSVLKDDTDGSMKKMMQENPESFYDMIMTIAGQGGNASAGAAVPRQPKEKKEDKLIEGLASATTTKKGRSVVSAPQAAGTSATSGGTSVPADGKPPAAAPANGNPPAAAPADKNPQLSDFERENAGLVEEFKKYGGIVNEDGSFKLGNTDILPAGDETDLSDRPGISRELVDLQKKLYDDKALFAESAKAEEARIRNELARKYAGNKKGLDAEVKKLMNRWRAYQFKKTRMGAMIEERIPAFAH